MNDSVEAQAGRLMRRKRLEKAIADLPADQQAMWQDLLEYAENQDAEVEALRAQLAEAQMKDKEWREGMWDWRRGFFEMKDKLANVQLEANEATDWLLAERAAREVAEVNVKASEKLCRTYFEIAEEVVGAEKVRALRNEKIDRAIADEQFLRAAHEAAVGRVGVLEGCLEAVLPVLEATHRMMRREAARNGYDADNSGPLLDRIREALGRKGT